MTPSIPGTGRNVDHRERAKALGLIPLPDDQPITVPVLQANLYDNIFKHINVSPTVTQARSNLLSFTEFVYPPYKADAFHEDMALWLDKVVSGEVLNLIIEAPPQHGKSMLVSHHLPSYWLAKNPDDPVLLTSYAADKAHDNSRRARGVLQTQQWTELFPTVVGDDPGHWRAHDWGIKGNRGYVFAAGVGGPVTGHGFRLGLIDDPFENWEKAQSETTRRTVWEWWQGTFITRIWEHGRIVIIMTRWHEDDLVGRILEEEGTADHGGRWVVRRYPALVDNQKDADEDPLGRDIGEPLAPSRFSAAFLETVKSRVGPMVWNAEYQQRPTRPEGDFFKIGRVRIESTPPADICKLVQVDPNTPATPYEVKRGIRFWDLAATAVSRASRDPDYTVGTLVAEDKDGMWWVLDVVRTRLDPEQVQDIVYQTTKLDGKRVKQVIEQEPGAAGKTMISNYIRILAGYPCEGKSHAGDKAAWADGWAGQVNAGNVILLAAPWNKLWLAEHAGFPNAKHDDQVDSAAGAFNVAVEGERQFKHMKFLKV
jgi:predicted phage terminase large subunit-like protein